MGLARAEEWGDVPPVLLRHLGFPVIRPRKKEMSLLHFPGWAIMILHFVCHASSLLRMISKMRGSK